MVLACCRHSCHRLAAPFVAAIIPAIVPPVFALAAALHSPFPLPLGPAHTFALTLLLLPAVVAVPVAVYPSVAIILAVPTVPGTGAPGKSECGDCKQKSCEPANLHGHPSDAMDVSVIWRGTANSASQKALTIPPGGISIPVGGIQRR